jgi:hypothetical protein
MLRAHRPGRKLAEFVDVGTHYPIWHVLGGRRGNGGAILRQRWSPRQHGQGTQINRWMRMVGSEKCRVRAAW